MDNLYFKMFEKYAPALSLLWPSQLQNIRDALDIYSETGKIKRFDDKFAELAFVMILCDLRHERKKGKKKAK